MCERGASTWRERLEQAGKECLDKEKWCFFSGVATPDRDIPRDREASEKDRLVGIAASKSTYTGIKRNNFLPCMVVKFK